MNVRSNAFTPTDIAFKEWSLVCDALEAGETSILLRKGGIAEGRGGFSFQHERFWFFPTYFHTQEEGVRRDFRKNQALPPSERELGDTVEFSLAAEIVAKARIDDWAVVEGLEPYHPWTEEVLRERFEYEEDRCLWLAVVRTYQSDPVREEEMSSRFKGCRSWINLPEEGTERAFRPIQSDEQAASMLAELRGIVPGLE